MNNIATEKLDRVKSVADEASKVDSVAESSNSVKSVKADIKKCKVLYWNKHDTNFAFRYDNKNIQITLPKPPKKCGDFVRIKCVGEKYEIVAD